MNLTQRRRGPEGTCLLDNQSALRLSREKCSTPDHETPGEGPRLCMMRDNSFAAKNRR
jgi:hypothetical protein